MKPSDDGQTHTKDFLEGAKKITETYIPVSSYIPVQGTCTLSVQSVGEHTGVTLIQHQIRSV